MEILIYVVIYLLSVWITRYILKIIIISEEQAPDGMDILICFIPGLNIILAGLLFLIFGAGKYPNKFFNLKK